MANHALFYPQWEIRDPVFLAESLLYWDRFACIVPFKGFAPRPSHPDQEIQKVMAEAHEAYVSPLVPTDEQKKRVHQRIAAFTEKEAPVWWQPRNLNPERCHLVSEYKFAPETFELLRKRGWAYQAKGSGKLGLQVVADSAADLLVGVLADECSSSSMPQITNDPGSFVANCNSLLAELDSPTGLALEQQGGRQPPAPENSEVAFLLAKVPHLGLEAGRVNAHAFRRLLQARKDQRRREVFARHLSSWVFSTTSNGFSAW